MYPSSAIKASPSVGYLPMTVPAAANAKEKEVATTATTMSPTAIIDAFLKKLAEGATIVQNVTGPPTRFHDLYDTKRRLGKGSYGSVFLATEIATGKDVAVKIIKRRKHKKWQEKKVRMEVDNLKKFSYSMSTITFIDYFEEDDAFYIVQELAEGGSLFRNLTKSEYPYSEEDARFVAMQLFMTVREMHLEGVVHRDIKLENILLANPLNPISIKLADFGSVSVLRSRKHCTTKNVGSPIYGAPEVMLGRDYGKECDLWSIGTVLYLLLSKNRPFVAETVEKMYQMIDNGAEVEFIGPCWERVSAEAKQCIKGLLEADPSKRWTAEDALRSPWIMGPEYFPSHPQDHVDPTSTDTATEYPQAKIEGITNIVG